MIAEKLASEVAKAITEKVVASAPLFAKAVSVEVLEAVKPLKLRVKATVDVEVSLADS